MNVPWDIERVRLETSKHFSLKYLKRWSWDFYDLRDAIREAYKIEKVGSSKYEVYVEKKGFKKIITVYYDSSKMLFCITGSEGGGRT